MKPDRLVLGSQITNWLLAEMEGHAYEILTLFPETLFLVAGGNRHFLDKNLNNGLDTATLDWLGEELVVSQKAMEDRVKEIQKWLGD